MPNEETTYREGIGHRLTKQDNMLSEILAQTTKTNGRVSTLETDRKIDRAVHDAQLKLIRRLLYAFATGLTFVAGSVAVPILSALIQAGRL